MAILVAIVFIWGNYYGYSWLAKKQAALESNYVDSLGDKLQAEIDLQKQDTWAERKAWVQQHEPALGDEGSSKAQVLEYVLKGARDNKLEIVEQNLEDTQRGPGGACVAVNVKVKGPMEGLCRWLSAIEKPNDFYAILSITLKADQDQKSMQCTAQIARYFKEGS